MIIHPAWAYNVPNMSRIVEVGLLRFRIFRVVVDDFYDESLSHICIYIYIHISYIYIYLHNVLGTGTVIGVPSPAVLHIFGQLPYGPILFPS